MTTTRPGRPPKYPEGMKVVSYRLRPRTAEAISATCKAKNLTQAELLDRLCLRAGLYGADEILGPELLPPKAAEVLAQIEVRPAFDGHAHRATQLSTGGAPKCACGAVKLNGEWR